VNEDLILMEGFFTIIVVFFIILIWALPIILISKSSRTQGGEKVAWILAVIFISWLAWVFYLLLAPLKSNQYQR